MVAFEYPATAEAPTQLWDGFLPDLEGGASRTHASPADAALRAELEQKIAEEARRAFESGRERGRQEARQADLEAQAAAERQHRVRAVELVAAFARERDRYLQGVEHEVVELALAIAARVLRREAQMDPLLLTGAVRVALGQLSASTEVTLRVPPAELDLWAEAVVLLPNLALKPHVIPGEGMRLGECLIETALGSVDLGIRAQLGEIERGFFDRTSGRAAHQAEHEPAQAARRTSPGPA